MQPPFAPPPLDTPGTRGRVSGAAQARHPLCCEVQP
eukprot:gene39148-12180_t